MPTKPTFFAGQGLSASPQSTGLQFSTILNNNSGSSIRDLVAGVNYNFAGGTPPTWGTGPDGPWIVGGATDGHIPLNYQGNLGGDFTVIYSFASTATDSPYLLGGEDKYEGRCALQVRFGVNGGGNMQAGKVGTLLKLRKADNSLTSYGHTADGLLDGNLHRIVIVHTSSDNTSKMYVDGTLTETISDVEGSLDLSELDNGVTLLGSSERFDSSYFEVVTTTKLNEFHTYTRALSAGDVTTHQATPYDMAAVEAGGGDVTAPTVLSAVINAAGDTLTLTFSEPVTGVFANQYGLTGGHTLSTVGGSGGARTMAISPVVLDSETGLNLTYNGTSTVDLADPANQLATIIGLTVNNGSTVPDPEEPEEPTGITHHLPIYSFFVLDSTTGRGVTGLTPTFLSFNPKDLTHPENPVTAPPIWPGTGGWYHFNYDTEGDGPFTCEIDCGAAVEPATERYKHLHGDLALPDQAHNLISFSDVPVAFLGANTELTRVFLPPNPDNNGINQIKDIVSQLDGNTVLYLLGNTPAAAGGKNIGAILSDMAHLRKMVDKIAGKVGTEGGTRVKAGDSETQTLPTPDGKNLVVQADGDEFVTEYPED